MHNVNVNNVGNIPDDKQDEGRWHLIALFVPIGRLPAVPTNNGHGAPATSLSSLSPDSG